MRYFVNYHTDAITSTENNEVATKLLNNNFVEVNEKEYERMYNKIWDIRLNFGY